MLSGRVSAHGNVAFAALMFCVMLYFYAQNLMGGGDVKIWTVGFLWVRSLCIFPSGAARSLRGGTRHCGKACAAVRASICRNEVIRSQLGRHLWKWRSPRAHRCEYQLDLELTCPASAEPETT
jgi:hypothetical protein